MASLGLQSWRGGSDFFLYWRAKQKLHDNFSINYSGGNNILVTAVKIFMYMNIDKEKSINPNNHVISTKYVVITTCYHIYSACNVVYLFACFVPVDKFSVMSGRVFLGKTNHQCIKSIAQGHSQCFRWGSNHKMLDLGDYIITFVITWFQLFMLYFRQVISLLRLIIT